MSNRRPCDKGHGGIGLGLDILMVSGLTLASAGSEGYPIGALVAGTSWVKRLD